MGILNAAYSFMSLMPSSLPSLYQSLILIGFLIVAILLPLILSLLLTTFKPEPRIVPPFWITVVSFAWLFVLLINSSNVSTLLLPTIIVGLFYVTIGRLEDVAAIAILGIAAERESIYYEYLIVYSDIDDVKAKLTIPEIRNALLLAERVEGNAEQGYLFKTKKGFTFKSRILITRNNEYPKLTDLKIVYFEKGSYSLEVSPNFLENAKKNSVYLKDILCNREPKLGFEVVVELTNTARDSLIDKIIDEMHGYYLKSKQLSNVDKFVIFTFVGVLILTIALFMIEQPLYAGLSIAIDVLLAVSELPDIIRKHRA